MGRRRRSLRASVKQDGLISPWLLRMGEALIAVVAGVVCSYLLIRTALWNLGWSPEVRSFVLYDEWQRFYDSFPLWVAAGHGVPCAVITLVVWRLMGRGRKKSEGSELCGQCDYNLTGNVSGMCPECGTRIPEEKKNKLTADRPAG